MKVKSAIHYSRLTLEEQKELDKKNIFKNYMLVICGTIIYSISFCWLIQLGGFFAGGVSGISQIIISYVNKFGSNEELKLWISNNLGTLVALLNIPLLIFGWKGVSKHFAIRTLISIIIQFIVINVFTTFTVSPFCVLFKSGEELIDAINNGTSTLGSGFFDVFNRTDYSFFKQAMATPECLVKFQNTMLPGTRFMLAAFGGLFCGIGASMALKGGGSTGGADIIANYLYSKKNISFTSFSIITDAIIISLSSVISVENVLYTLVRLFAYMLTLKFLYKAYSIERIEIISEKGLELADEIIKQFKHGVTIYDCMGGYTHKPKHQLVIYTNDFELNNYLKFIKDFDEKAFITVSQSSIYQSNFVQHTIG